MVQILSTGSINNQVYVKLLTGNTKGYNRDLKKADNRVVLLSSIGWLTFSDQFYYYNCLKLKKHEDANVFNV